jgi:hypothetical protein
MSDTNLSTAGHDPLAHADNEPRVDALIKEFDLAMNQGPGRSTGNQATDIAVAETTRYNWRAGKSHDGLLHQKNMPSGVTVRPYDHRPDTDCFLTDETVNAQVDLDMVALHNSRAKATATHAAQLTSKQMAQVRSLVNWMRNGPLLKDLVDDGELLSQTKNTLGWAVLHPCWRKRHGLRRETLTLEQITALAQQAGPDSALGQLPLLILDETLEAQAVEMALQAYPYLKKKTATRIVRELRADGTTEFLYRELMENGPALKVLIPGITFFCAAETGKLSRSRAIFTLENYSQAELEAMVIDEGWDQDFVDAAIAKAGQSSSGLYAHARQDTSHRNIEILTSYVRSVDEDGVSGIYCTVFSKFVNNLYAKHFLLDYAHNEYPFIEVRTEVNGLRPNDCRGAAEVLRTDQFAVKRAQDAILIDLELSTPSMLKRTGPTMSKLPPEITPGGVWNGPPGSNLEAMDLTQFSKPDMAQAVISNIYVKRDAYFGLPNNEAASHPSRWQSRQQRNAIRWLVPWGQAFWQLAVLCCDEYSEDELTIILGCPPLINSQMLLKYQIQLQYDMKMLDTDYIVELVKAVSQFVLPFDRSGTVDMSKFVSWILSSFDPTLADEITNTQAGASAAVFNEVRQEVAWIMQGNEANYTQNDPTAGQKLQFLGQILQQNPAYQAILLPAIQGQPNPQFNAMVFAKMKKYEENLQHSVQETQISPAQGRLGVTPGGMEQGPQSVLPDEQGQG